MKKTAYLHRVATRQDTLIRVVRFFDRFQSFEIVKDFLRIAPAAKRKSLGKITWNWSRQSATEMSLFVGLCKWNACIQVARQGPLNPIKRGVTLLLQCDVHMLHLPKRAVAANRHYTRASSKHTAATKCPFSMGNLVTCAAWIFAFMRTLLAESQTEPSRKSTQTDVLWLQFSSKSRTTLICDPATRFAPPFFRYIFNFSLLFSLFSLLQIDCNFHYLDIQSVESKDSTHFTIITNDRAYSFVTSGDAGNFSSVRDHQFFYHSFSQFFLSLGNI